MKAIWIVEMLIIVAATAYSDETAVDSSLFGDLKTRAIGPAVMSGRITAIDCVLDDPRIIYVGTADGGIWKSVNGGLTFMPVFSGHTQSIGCLAIDQEHPETLWAGTGECNVRNSVSVGTGLYRTEDGGENWEFIGLNDSERISRIVIDSTNPGTVYAAVMGHLWDSNTERGVYKTEDKGKTWTRILYVDENTGCADLEMDPQEPHVLYAAMWEFRREPWFFTSGGKGSGLFKSIDSGRTWKSIRKGLPEGDLGRIALAVAPSRPGTLYAVVEAEETALYRSDEMGESWKKVNESCAVGFRPFYISHLVVDPKDHRRLYIASFHLCLSSDGGETVRPAAKRVHPDMHAIWVNPRNPDQVMIGTDGGVYLSNDQARHFSFVSGLPLSQFYHVSCDMAYPYNVYGGLQDNGSWKGPSRGGGPGIRNRAWRLIGTNDGMAAVRLPRDPDLIYNEWMGGGLELFNERTGERKNIQPLPKEEGDAAYRFNWNTPFVLSPLDKETVFMGSQFLFRSEDRGDTWERISPDLTTNDPMKLRQEASGGLSPENSSAENHCTIYTIAPSPLDPNIIWAGTDDGNVQVTRNGGGSWENVVERIPGLPKNTWCSFLEAGHHDPGTVYAAFDGHRTGDMRPYVYKSEDCGRSWQSLGHSRLKGYCHVIREDPVRAGLLFLGTEFGLFVSINGGREWAHLTEALPEVSVRDLVIHPREHDLVIATHGLGIHIIDDITPLRALTPDLMEREACILPSRASVLEVPSKFQEFPGDTVFYGESYGGALITYYLKKRHLFGSLTLDVLDPEGNLVTTLPTSKRRGLNRIHWNLRLEAPKVPETPGVLHRFSYGPHIDEGTYTLRLTKGKETFTGKLEVVPHPLSGHGREDRRCRFETVMKLYKLRSEVGSMTSGLSSMSSQIEELLPKVEKEELRSRLKAYREELGRFHGTIEQHNRRSFARKLVEKLSWLYDTVNQYGGRPTRSQLRYLSLLVDEARQAEMKYGNLLGDAYASINAALVKEGFKALRLLEEEESDTD